VNRSRLVTLTLGAVLLAGVACYDRATGPRSLAKDPSSFEVGPATYSALWTFTANGFSLQYAGAPAVGPVRPGVADSARASALRAQFQGFVPVSPPTSASATGQASATLLTAGNRQAVRLRRIFLGTVNGKKQYLGVLPGHGAGAPLAAFVLLAADNSVSAVVQLQHRRKPNGKWQLSQSRTTVFDKNRKAVAALDQSYATPGLGSALRSGSSDLMRRVASLAVPDALYAEDTDTATVCALEKAAVSVATTVAAAAAINLSLASSANLAAVAALAALIAACPETGGGSCLLIPAAEAAVTASIAAVADASAISAAAIATLAVAVADLASCEYQAHKPTWLPEDGSQYGDDGGDTGGGDYGDGGDDGGGGSGCTFYVEVDDYGNILGVDDPNGCLGLMT
jgi:hypothetical protein